MFQMIMQRAQTVTFTNFTQLISHGLNHKRYANPRELISPYHGAKKPTMSLGSWSKTKSNIFIRLDLELTTEQWRDSG